jgi:hypothetical protein
MTRDTVRRLPRRGEVGEPMRANRSHRVTGPAASYGYDPADVRCHVSIPCKPPVGLLVLALSRLVLLCVTVRV